MHSTIAEDMRVRGSITFPTLPDTETADVRPHEDGHPWLKSCSVCACRVSDPQQLGPAYQAEIMQGTSDTLFYCLHRGGEDAPYHRVCGAYASLHPEQALPTPPTHKGEGE